MENLTEEMRRLTEGANKRTKSPEEIAEEKAMVAECMKRNPFAAGSFNLTRQMWLMSNAPKVAEQLQSDAAVSTAERIANLEKAVVALGGTVDGMGKSVEKIGNVFGG